MTRMQRILVPLLLSLSLYAFAWLLADDLPLIGQAHARQYLLLIPVLAIAALGGYCLFELVWGVVSMGNAEEAYRELQKDIADAKLDLKAKGIHVD
ncbi:dolichol-phosphate mannosyltransferase subunit 3 [Cystobasidium minutum MCA 4210]|uniref:dolichol-phosphate mannosyltransferase subunit 3 n=1 Tax=Cystobasidium minutum MCA 4210 TaxID=1397322 RepID=UPI0034CF9406|eukprot:jgi/Rhomi1/166091/fgenesh1_kg.1_\